jgi:hypothetical protein
MTNSLANRSRKSTPDVEDNHAPPGCAHGGRTPTHHYRSQRGSMRGGTPILPHWYSGCSQKGPVPS